MSCRLERAVQLDVGLADLRGELRDHRDALGDLLLGRAAVDGQAVHAGADLLLEAADPLHEELVEIAADDRQELDALEQRRARVARLVQHAAIELEPGQLAVQVELGRAQIDVGASAPPPPAGRRAARRCRPDASSPARARLARARTRSTLGTERLRHLGRRRGRGAQGQAAPPFARMPVSLARHLSAPLAPSYFCC